MSQSYPPLDELMENFEILDDWEDRYRYLIDLGKNLSGLSEEQKTEENKVRGCTSQVWIVHRVDYEAEPTEVTFEADSDAFIVRGLVVILLSAYSHRAPEEILGLDIKLLFQRMGLERNLSFSRRNGFFSMVEKIRAVAQEHAERQ